MEELDIVSNQNLSIEMFLIRLLYLKGYKPKNGIDDSEIKIDNKEENQKNISSKIINKETIDQIKNVSQEKKLNPQIKIETNFKNEIRIKSFNDLIELCNEKKEIKLKYELEKNVNLVKFENGRIEISFNDNLERDFVKDLSSKLLEWTKKRWIITLTKNQGAESIKDKEKNQKKELLENTKKSQLYKTVIKYFSDAELVDVVSKKD